MKVHDQAAWRRCVVLNGDGYSSAAIEYAQRFGDMMEQYMSENDCGVFEAADACRFKAAEGLGLSFMQASAATSELCRHWKNGAILELWRKGKQ